MSWLNGVFSNNGSNFQAQGADVISPLSGQAQGSIDQSQATIGQQQQLANALAQQNAAANQTAAYNQLGAVGQQFGNIASGQGPNPAQAMLSQQTGQNVANQAALMAGQRGASQNAGLIARQAGQQGAATQQQAVGQGATMQSQQMLAALGAQAGIAGQQAGIAGSQIGNQLNAQQALTGASQAQAGQLIGANVAANTAAIQNAQQQNSANVDIAKGNQAEQAQLLGGATGTSALANLAHGGKVQHYDDGGQIEDFGEGQVSQAGGDTDASGKKKGGAGIGAVLALLAQGGEVTPQNYDAGGAVSSGPQSSFGKWQSLGNSYTKTPAGMLGKYAYQGLKSIFSGSSSPIADSTMANVQAQSPMLSESQLSNSNLGVTPQDAAASSQGAPSLGADTDVSSDASDAASDMSDDLGLAHGGKVPAMVSPGEKYIPPAEVKKVEQGKKPAIKAGETIKGKAKVPGDSLKNDTVPKTLKEGGIVLPRSVTQSKHPGPAAQKFVEALMAKQGKKRAA